MLFARPECNLFLLLGQGHAGCTNIEGTHVSYYMSDGLLIIGALLLVSLFFTVLFEDWYL